MQGAPAPHQKVPVFPGCHVGYSLHCLLCASLQSHSASALANKDEDCRMPFDVVVASYLSSPLKRASPHPC
jgi:hypothetical protein